jgi:subtilisin family serine protease
VAATVAAAMVAGSWLAAGSAPVSAAHTAAKAGSTTVTLITGDQVTVLPAGGATVKPAKGREKMVFTTKTDRQHQYVIPADAIRLINTGKLDVRLFDVKTLIAAAYDDAHSKDLPLILQYAKNAQPKLAGAQVSRQLPALGMTAVRESKATASSFWSSAATTKTTAAGVDKIWLDGKRKVTLNESVPQIGAPAAWAAGYTGKGTTTAILDTGIDATHPDFAGKIADSKDFSGTGSTDDGFGHGTHVASIITGSGAASNGKYKGVAPDTKLAIGKVCDNDGGCLDSAIIDGMTWAAKTVHAQVVNLSLGGPDFPGIDPLEQAVNDLSQTTGALFVIAAGNSGCDQCVGSPGSADAALTVAAVTKKDQLADFSSRGPRVGDGAIKPDIAAPGVDIVAAKAKNGVIGDPSDNPNYVALSGTSMATPHVAGSAAIVASEHPDWTGTQIKSALTTSSKHLPGIGLFAQGAGRVDVGKAIGQDLLATPGSLSVPTQIWPHTDDKPVTQTLTYHNSGKTALTLALSAGVIGPDSKPAPAGMFTLSATSLAVPAGADASVTVTTNTKVSGADGEYSGEIVATGGAQSVRTPIAVNREVESYNLTVVSTDRSGAPAPITSVMVVDYGSTGFPGLIGDPDGDGSFTVRLHKGTYGLSTAVIAADFSELSQLDTPVLNLNKDTVLRADARKAKPVDISVDNPTARISLTDVGGEFYYPGGPFGSGIASFDGNGLFAANNGPATSASKYRSMISSTLADPGPDNNFMSTPYAYHLSVTRDGSMLPGATIHAKAAQLADVKNHQLAPGDGDVVERGAIPQFVDGIGGSGLIPLYGGSAPGTVDQYISPGTHWSLFNIYGSNDRFDQMWQGTESKQYAKKTYDETFNRGVFGPGQRFAEHVLSARTVQRPNELLATPQLLSDGDLTHSGVPRAYDTGSSVLYRNGTKVAEGDPVYLSYPAPSGPATFKLDAQITQHFMPVSTSVAASWTFKSDKTTDPHGLTLPLFSLRFTPKLDDKNNAPAGAFTLPVSVDRQDGAAKATVTNPTIEYSIDDGKTWQKATIASNGAGKWNAAVTNPASGFVSLRASATDSAGNTSTETIIRAYAVK